MSNTLLTPAKQSLSAIEANPWRAEIEALVANLKESIAPVWPLRDYVAVNPYASLGSRSFFAARQELQTYSKCELLPPMDYFASEYREGRLELGALRAAVAEMHLEVGYAEDLVVERIVQQLEQGQSANPRSNGRASKSQAVVAQPRVKPVSECLSETGTGVHWAHVIKMELGKFCAGYFDEGQALWGNPTKHASLYQAWRQTAALDCQLEWKGLTGFRAFVAGLPEDSDAALLQLLQSLDLPVPTWEKFLLSLMYSTPGWFSYARYRCESQGRESDFQDLLAIRLSYEVALAEHTEFDIAASVAAALEAEQDREVAPEASSEQELFRLILLRASELSYEQSLLAEVRQGLAAASEKPPASAGRKNAQLVFCIDVRSERYRRQLESLAAEVETFGFAGFFGVPMASVDLGSASTRNQLPVLLEPQFQVQLGVCGSKQDQTQILHKRASIRYFRAAWKAFATAATSCFTFVETNGFVFGGKLLTRTLGLSRSKNVALDGLPESDRNLLGPTLRGLNSQGITTTRQADLAANILKNLGLTKDFARLVVFCGHESQTENNPLDASLACGACGGHSGEANARFAALLLNQSYVRSALADKGIVIPEDTHFIAAVHNTTTDELQFFGQADLPSTHAGDLEELIFATQAATLQTRGERATLLSAGNGDVLRRAREWSEVRPEWGLAGNAAFVVAPRSMTKHCNLQGRSFLHSYEHVNDPDGSVLELIMTAPMVVAHWINMQYYASSVDPAHFGSGSKTIHNVVGKFGIFSGEGGDLQTGLPMESVHDGRQLQHKPLRLLSVIAAPREAIDAVLAKHAFLQDLIRNQWLHLLCVENGKTYRCHTDSEWTLVA